MQALRVQNTTSGFRLEKVEIPEIGAEDVLIKVAVAGVTPGVVKMVRFGKSYLPTTVGHEAAGTIAAVGSRVFSVSVGERVRLHPALSCRVCLHCSAGQEHLCDQVALIGFARFGRDSELYSRYHDGTVAEYVRAPHWLVDRLPDNTSFEVGAKVHDLATALRALKLAKLSRRSTIVLTAPTGAMGVLTLKLACEFPIGKIILVGRSRERVERVRQITSIATEVFIPESLAEGIQAGTYAPQLKSLAPEGIDAVIDYMPNGNLLAQILPALRVGGTLVHMGGNADILAVPLVLIMNSCWDITGGRGNTRGDVVQILKLLGSGKLTVEELITHRFDLTNVQQALQLLESRAVPTWLSVILVSEETPKRATRSQGETRQGRD
ncbi:theronine dehydrogenase [Thozetella sp. PMI_491]|nr:theronine dehydrogenase [Thozetella sp. PMI_491]